MSDELREEDFEVLLAPAKNLADVFADIAEGAATDARVVAVAAAGVLIDACEQLDIDPATLVEAVQELVERGVEIVSLPSDTPSTVN